MGLDREDAENKAKEINERQKNKFCPMTKDSCCLECVGYVPPEVNIINELGQPPAWYVNGGYCGAYFMIGRDTA